MISCTLFFIVRIVCSSFALLLVIIFLNGVFLALADEIGSNLGKSNVYKEHRTQHGLYITVRDAHVALIRNPSIVLIDIRDPIEIFVEGYPEPMDINIPIFLISRIFNEVDYSYELISNTNFSAEVSLYMTSSGYPKSHPIFVICRDGSRAAEASELLFEAGYSTVWNIVGAYSTVGASDSESNEFTESWVGAGLPVRFKIRSEAEWKNWHTEN